MDYIEKTGQSHPDLVLPLARLGELYERKLYHQLTEEVVNFLKDPNHVGRLSYQDFYTVRLAVLIYHHSSFPHNTRPVTCVPSAAFGTQPHVLHMRIPHAESHLYTLTPS
jgi:hypothetical protein